MRSCLIVLVVILALCGSIASAGKDQAVKKTKKSKLRGKLRQIQHRGDDNSDGSEEVTAASLDPISSTPKPRSYLSVKACDMLFYCLEGLQGPCPPNKMLVPHNGSVDDHPFPCSSLSTYPWRGCLSSKQLSEDLNASISTVQPGQCVFRYSHYPCYGYPSYYRFYQPTQTCYPLTPRHWNGHRVPKSVNPCEHGQAFSDLDGINGQCTCHHRNFLMFNGTCYRALTQGPCEDGQWLEYADVGVGECHNSPCSASQMDGSHIFWMAPGSRTGGCYLPNTRGPCQDGQLFFIDDYPQQIGHCRGPYRRRSQPARYRPIYRHPPPHVQPDFHDEAEPADDENE